MNIKQLYISMQDSRKTLTLGSEKKIPALIATNAAGDFPTSCQNYIILSPLTRLEIVPKFP